MTRRSALANAGRPSRVVAWLAILAFLLQGLIVQTHIHVASLEAAAPVQHGQAGSSNKAPADKAPADCPACQLQAATAAFVLTPHAVSLALINWVAAGFLTLPSTRVHAAPIRSWSSRAPPTR
jgi:hypothetical protein